MSLLTIIQNVANEIGLPTPSQVAGSNDSQIKQLLSLANSEGKSLALLNWEILTNEEVHTTVATESQGVLTTIVAADFDRIVPDTMWNRTEQSPISGSISNERWQSQKAVTTTGPTTEFRVRGGELLLIPVPSAGDSLTFEWVSNLWCATSGGTGQAAWAADSDVGILDERLMTMGIIWRFNKAKGLDWEADKIEYISTVLNKLSTDEPAEVLYMGGTHRVMPGVGVAEGNWPLP